MGGVVIKEGELMSDKINRILKTGVGVEVVQSVTYGDKYEPAADIRTDKWEVAQAAIMTAMDKRMGKAIVVNEPNITSEPSKEDADIKEIKQ